MINISKKDILWSYLGFFLNISTNIILLPFILKYLNITELGLWYTFASIGGLINLLDFGFSPTLTRNISYAWGGASKILKVGIINENTTGSPNYPLMSTIISATRKIYLIISLVALLLLVSIGSFYIFSISKNISGHNHLIAWGIYCVGIFINLFYSYWAPLLRGIGAIKEGQIATIYAKVLQIILTITGLILSYNLIAIAASFLISGFISRKISKYYFTKIIDQRELNSNSRNVIKEINKEIKKTFAIIWHNAWRLGLVSLGAFLITQSSTLICSSFFGLEATAKYGITLQLFTILATFSSTLYSIYLPELNQAFLYNSTIKIKQIISITSIINWIIYFVGALFIILFGNDILMLIGTKVSLLPISMTIFMAFFLFLENNHAMFATFITSENRVPFINAALLSGIAIVSFSLILATQTSLGIWSLLISQAVVQLAYNNWKWPMQIFKKYNLSISAMLKLTYSVINQSTIFSSSHIFSKKRPKN